MREAVISASATSDAPLASPSTESVDTVRNWLVSAGIENERIKQSKNKLWIEFEALIEEAEALRASNKGLAGTTRLTCPSLQSKPTTMCTFTPRPVPRTWLLAWSTHFPPRW